MLLLLIHLQFLATALIRKRDCTQEALELRATVPLPCPQRSLQTAVQLKHLHGGAALCRARGAKNFCS